MSKLHLALSMMNELIKNGIDWSEAAWQASEEFAVDCKKLEKLYDTQDDIFND